VGTQNVAHLESVSAATGVVLSRADLYRIIEASTGAPLP
jgi:predicted oxidoreductase